MSLTAPQTLPELLAAFDHVAAEITAAAERLDPAAWQRRPAEDAWNPRQLLDHILRSTAPIARSFGAPGAVLLRRFGAPEAGSRPFNAIEAVYRSELAGGAAAAGPFLPEEALTEAELVAEWRRAAADFHARLSSWSEADLDAHQLPHPLIGMLTLREMAMFAIYHCRHHFEEIRAIAQRP